MGSHCVCELERGRWIRRSVIQDAACLTFVRGNDLDAVAAAFGAVPAFGRRLDIDEFCEEAFACQEKHPMIALRRIGDWVLVVADNDGQGRRPEVLRRAGRTEAVSAFWDAQELTRFSYAAAGVVRTTFEAVLPEYREGTEPDALEWIRDGLPWSQADPVLLMVAMTGRITGLAAAPEWLEGDFLTFPVAPWPDDLVPLTGTLRDIDGYPPELLHRLREAGPVGQRRAALALARHVLAATNCLGLPVVQRLLTAGAVEQLDELVRELAWESILRPPCSEIRTQHRAVLVLRQATRADPADALTGVLAAARKVRGMEITELTRVVTAGLAC